MQKRLKTKDGWQVTLLSLSSFFLWGRNLGDICLFEFALYFWKFIIQLRYLSALGTFIFVFVGFALTGFIVAYVWFTRVSC